MPLPHVLPVDTKLEKTFENVYNPIEQISVPLNTAWATTKNLHYVNKNYRKAFARVRRQRYSKGEPLLMLFILFINNLQFLKCMCVEFVFYIN